LSQQAERVDEAIFAQVLGLAGTRIEVKPGPFLGVPPQKAWNPGPISSHPAAAVEAGRVDEAQSSLDVIRHAYYPHLGLQALISERGTGANAAGAPIGGSAGLWPDSATNWAAGFSVTFPLFDFASNRARKRIELANRRREEAVYDQTLQTLTGQVDQAQAVLEGARHVAENTPVELQASRDSETQAVARFRAGLGTLVDVAEAQRLLLQAEIDDSLATLNIWRALARLAAAQGNLQPFLDLANHAAVGGP
ncbi:MAG: TolC family protein, partial [Limisphaerales bacterium]